MILATHAIAGAAAAELFPSNPIVAFIAAFLSHFVLDAIPHWNYIIKSHKEDPNDPLDGKIKAGKDLVIDLSRVFLDLLLGTALALIFFSKGTYQNETIVLLGAFGGMLPDAFQFSYWLFKIEPLKSLQRFHVWVHHKIEWRLSAAWGIPLQIIIIAAIVIASKLLL